MYTSQLSVASVEFNQHQDQGMRQYQHGTGELTVSDLITLMYKISMNLFCGLGFAMAFIMLKVFDGDNNWFVITMKVISAAAIILWLISMAYICFFLFNNVFLEK
ncbi:hypothetical protein ABN352_01380 [Providencia rettgeri]